MITNLTSKIFNDEFKLINSYLLKIKLKNVYTPPNFNT